MTIPSVKAPAGTPRFLYEGHAVEEDSVFAQVKFATGHSRARRRWTTTERVVEVSWFLTQQRLLAVDYWYQNTLEAGSKEFAAEVKRLGAGTQWWTARWISYQCEMRPGNRGVITGSILLTGEPSDTGPTGSALELAVSASLIDTRSAVSVTKRLQLHVSAALVSPTLLGLNVNASLLSIYTTLGLREAGGFELREDGGRELRE